MKDSVTSANAKSVGLRTSEAPFAAAHGYASARDWHEDAPHENGNYQCRCCQCEQTFVGHKRRVVCKVCDEENRRKWAAMSEEERAEVRRQRESEFIHWMMGQRHSS